MNTEQFLYDCGIVLPKVEFIPEYLIDTYSDDCFFIDWLPMNVSKENAHKFDQLEDDYYEKTKGKFLNILKKLWLYDNVYFDSELIYEIEPSDKISESLLQEFNELIKSTKISKSSQLELLIDLSYRNIIDISLVFEQFQILITPSWSCYFTFIKDSSYKKFLEEIVRTEGLYLRKAKVHN